MKVLFGGFPMGFLGFILTIVGIVAFIFTIVFGNTMGDSKSNDGGDVAILIFLALVAVVSLFSAGYCIG